MRANRCPPGCKSIPAKRQMMPVEPAARRGPKLVSMDEINCSDDSHRARTKAEIVKARARGVSWGRHGKALAARNREDAETFAEALRPLLMVMPPKVLRSPTAIAHELNGRGVSTPRGGRWHPTSVRRLLGRLGPSLMLEINRREIIKAPERMAAYLPPDHPALLEAIAKRDALLKEAAE